MQLKQTQVLTHKLILTQSMRQSLQCLQFSAHELNDYVQEAALSNPLLEVKTADFYEALPMDALVSTLPEREIDFYNTPYFKAPSAVPPFPLDLFASREQSITEYLTEQLGQMRLVNDEMRKVCQYLIACLDHRGYLDCPLSELAEETGYSAEALEQALYVIQMLDPTGVGARDLSECLVLQLAQSKHFNRLTLALAQTDLDLLAKRDYTLLARKLSAPVAEIKKAAKIIFSLNPIPSRGFSSLDRTAYMAPDFIVSQEQGKLHITLNEKLIPQITINADYALLAEHSDDAETKRYAKEMLSEANSLIHNIAQRSDTLLRLVDYVLSLQSGFFCGEQMRPVTMQQAAEALSVHVSTVSRAVQNKYLQFEGCIYPLRAFFSIALHAGNTDVSSQAVRNRIAYLISHEEPSAPLSDEVLRQLLEKDGISISRRAVAGHRGVLGFPIASKRKSSEKGNIFP